MLNFIKKKIEKSRQKRTFKEYDYVVKSFQIAEDRIGKIDYAAWLHPFEKPKIFTDDDIRFYKKIVQKGAMAIDIGAHTGDTTLPMALAAGKEGLILALEPNQYVYKILEKNASLNKDSTNIVPLCFAATSEDGEFTFNYSDASFCNGGFLSQNKNKKHGHDFTLKVKGVNLERYLFENYKDDLSRLKLIKVDAEGYDAQILRSIPKIINDYKPNLIVECYKRLTLEERNELYDVIEGYGYDIFYLENFEKNGEKKKIEKKNMTAQRHFDILAIIK